MMFLMLTNILKESTDLLCVGQGSVQMVVDAFHLNLESGETSRGVVSLPGVVSRKKQLVPGLMVAIEQ